MAPYKRVFLCIAFITTLLSPSAARAEAESHAAATTTSAIADDAATTSTSAIADEAAAISSLTPPDIDARHHLPHMPEKLSNSLRSDDDKWWFTLLKSGNLNLKDTTVRYPKFVKFCVNVYNWADHFFNYYEPEYVVGTGKRWKARLVSDNWASSHYMVFPTNLKINMLTNPYSNIGAYLQYMAVSVGYTFDINNLGLSKKMDHSKWEFGFNCSLFDAEIRYYENTAGTNIRRFGDYHDGKLIKKKFPGVQRYTFEVRGIYFFNHKRYSQGAAYNFSRIQKKSQGSWIVGLSYADNDITFDFTELPIELLPYLTIPVGNYHFHYRSIAAVGGYGYNWVPAKNLVVNGTLTPALGVTHCYEDSLEGERWMPSINLGLRTAVTYNLGNLFFSATFRVDSHWYKSNVYSLFSAIENLTGNVGIRF